jgi:hypothetical protein
MMRHRFGLRMEHRMIDQMLDSRSASRSDDDLSNDNLVWTDVGANMVDRPDPTSRLVQRGLIAHISDDNLLRAQLLDWLNLFMAIDQRPDRRSFGGQCADDRSTCFAACASD